MNKVGNDVGHPRWASKRGQLAWCDVRLRFIDGSWVARSLACPELVGTGSTPEEAARDYGREELRCFVGTFGTGESE